MQTAKNTQYIHLKNNPVCCLWRETCNKDVNMDRKDTNLRTVAVSQEGKRETAIALEYKGGLNYL